MQSSARSTQSYKACYDLCIHGINDVQLGELWHIMLGRLQRPQQVMHNPFDGNHADPLFRGMCRPVEAMCNAELYARMFNLKSLVAGDKGWCSLGTLVSKSLSG
jgi:hypothetical protein